MYVVTVEDDTSLATHRGLVLHEPYTAALYGDLHQITSLSSTESMQCPIHSPRLLEPSSTLSSTLPWFGRKKLQKALHRCRLWQKASQARKDIARSSRRTWWNRHSYKLRFDKETILFTRTRNNLLSIPSDRNQRNPVLMGRMTFQEIWSRCRW